MPKKSDDIRKEIDRKYNKNPRGWHILTGKSNDNFYNSVVLHDRDMWIIKEEFLNPFKTIGLGDKIKIGDEFKPMLKSPYSYGFRPLTDGQYRMIMDEDFSSRMIHKILSTEPLPSDNIISMALEGPIISTPNIKFSDEQEKLDIKLRKSLRKLIFNEYPELTKGYV